MKFQRQKSMEKHWNYPNGRCGILTFSHFSMKLNLLMERETAWLCCSWMIVRLFSFTSFLPFLFISRVPEFCCWWSSRALTKHRLCCGVGDLSQGNVWVWISLHLKGHKNDFCWSWRIFSTEWSIPSSCWNSFIFCFVVPFSKQVFSFSSFP